MNIRKEYDRWMENATADEDLIRELSHMKEGEIEDAFYRDLTFGTGGLRGVIGAGTNRMNVYTVAKATQGLAAYIRLRFGEGKRAVAIGYDSRIKSDAFAKTAAGVLAANGIRVHLYPELMPTPCVSFAVRALGCAAGVVITASHNPAKYNGYKVYGADGCQITTAAAAEILSEIQRVDVFTDVRQMDFAAAQAQGLISYIGEDVITAFIDCVKKETLLSPRDVVDRDIAIVYTPLNGTGRMPVTRALREAGFRNITVVKEQEWPDGNFPTCPYPNPEIREALALGIACAQERGADLLLATDPDCDRVGIAVKNKEGKHVLLSGNEVGMLLLDYICARRIANGSMPRDPVMVKTIVTIDMAERIAARYGVRTVNVLTGFKFIGEQIGLLEQQEKADSYILGFEESYGYLSGSYVRDKDAVNASFLICEMFAYYASRGIGLLDKLEELYSEYGYCLNTLHSYEFEGAAGMAKMQGIMGNFRSDISSIGGKRVEKLLDYAPGLDGLPQADVLKFLLADNCSVVVRPSGTEPKLKVYISVSAPTRAKAEEEEINILRDVEAFLA